MIPYGIGRGFDRSRTNGWYIRVRGEKEYFASEELRDGEYDRRIAEAKLYGEKAAGTVTPGDRQLLQELQRLTAPTGYTPLEIFERGLTLVGRRPRATMSVEKAVERLLAVSKARQKEGLIRPRRLKELRNVLTRFSTAFAIRELQTIGREDVNDFLMGLGVGPQTRINNARVISRLFSWAKDEIGCVTDNPVVITERVRRIPAVFTAEQAANLLEKLSPVSNTISLPMLIASGLSVISTRLR